MPWDERLAEAAYTSPSGVRLTFSYEDVSKVVEKRTSAHDFTGVDGTLVQDLGRSGRRFPLRVILWGGDYDQRADEFEAALLERGVGTLEHPIYGTANVIPFGPIERNDRLRSAAGQAIIQVAFWETTETVYPTRQTDQNDVAADSVGEFNEATANEFNLRVAIDTAIERVTLRNQTLRLTGALRSVIGPIADVSGDVGRAFDANFQSIQTGIDLLVGQPLTLAFQTLILIETPTRGGAAIGAQLDAYRQMADDLIARALPVAGLDNVPVNEFATSDLYGLGFVAGSAAAAIQTEFTNQTEAIGAADALDQIFVAISDWRELGFDSVAELDTGEAYQATQRLVAATQASLIEQALRLPQERSVTLSSPRNVFELAAELLGTVDAGADELISLNRLTGDEILELPAGRRVIYYA